MLTCSRRLKLHADCRPVEKRKTPDNKIKQFFRKRYVGKCQSKGKAIAKIPYIRMRHADTATFADASSVMSDSIV